MPFSKYLLGAQFKKSEPLKRRKMILKIKGHLTEFYYHYGNRIPPSAFLLILKP
jgi:hypothetical protein